MVGRTLLHYRIVEKIGEGGMGVVYEAHDLKLDRRVALKFLPHDLAERADERARLLQEARAASALNHPNVCVIHAIEEHEGQPFIVMEYVEGVTLAERLRDTILSLADAVSYATQIASALEAAHEKGIVHRDIKSENVMVGSHGQVKVMDFGLARLRDSLRRTRSAATTGTLYYLAPEQIRGQAADVRADLFSFGVVLYEMLTGRRPFEGEHEAAVLYAILNTEPEPVAALRPGLPSELVHVVGKALEKEREERYQTAHDLVVDLKRAKRELEGRRGMAGAPQPFLQAAPALEAPSPPAVPRALEAAAPARPRPGRRPWRALATIAAVGLVVVAVALFAFFRLGNRPAPVAPLRWQQLTFSGKAAMPALSPDGTMFAYVTSEAGSESRVMVQDVEGGQPVEVFKATTMWALRWTHAGNELAVSAWRGSALTVFLVPRMGGNFRTYRGRARSVALSPDDRTLASTFEDLTGIRLVDTSRPDTSSIPVLAPRTWLFDCDWSPDGRHLLYLVQAPSRWSIWTTQRDGKRQREIYRDSLEIQGPRWAPRGGAIYCLRRAGASTELLRIPVSADGGPARRTPKVLASDPQLRGQFSISRDGRRLLLLRSVTRSSLWRWQRRVDDPAGSQRQLRVSTAPISNPQLSPEGRRVAYLSYEGVRNVHVLSLTDSTDTQVTFMKRDVGGILGWSPSGGHLAIVAWDGAANRVWLVAADASASRVFPRTVVSETETDVGSWWPGREILYPRPGNRNFAVLDPATGRERALVANDSVGWMFSPAVSPDSVHVAVSWNRPPASGTWAVSLVDTTQRLLLPTSAPWRVYPAQWSPDGRSVIGRSGNCLVRISLATGDSATVLRFPYRDVSELDFTPDLETLVFTRAEINSDVWYTDDFDPEVK